MNLRNFSIVLLSAVFCLNLFLAGFTRGFDAAFANYGLSGPSFVGLEYFLNSLLSFILLVLTLTGWSGVRRVAIALPCFILIFHQYSHIYVWKTALFGETQPVKQLLTESVPIDFVGLVLILIAFGLESFRVCRRNA